MTEAAGDIERDVSFPRSKVAFPQLAVHNAAANRKQAAMRDISLFMLSCIDSLMSVAFPQPGRSIDASAIGEA